MNLPDLRDVTTQDESLREVATDEATVRSAKRIAEEQLDISMAKGNSANSIRLFGYLGNVCRILGELTQSVDYLERAVALCRSEQSPKSELINTIRLAEAHKYNGEHKVAEELLRDALLAVDERRLEAHKDFVLQHLGKCRLEQGAMDDAIEYLEQALQLRLKKGDSELIQSTDKALRLAQTVLGAKPKEAHLVPYSTLWKIMFSVEERRLRSALGAYAVDIQHIGSTAIPELSAKPILDIAVGVDSLEFIDAITVILSTFGYFRIQVQFDGKVVFAKDTKKGFRTHYLHVEPYNAVDWQAHIAFRDHLRINPARAEAYVNWKRELAAQFSHDIKEYTFRKQAFIEQILQS